MKMTREEAIDVLKAYLMFDKSSQQVAEALDMAIEALQADAVQGGDAEMQTIAKTPDYMQQSRHDDGNRKDTVTLNSPISIQAEMVAVVRCKDCIHGSHKTVIDGDNIKWCEIVEDNVEDKDYCSRGERREE